MTVRSHVTRRRFTTGAAVAFVAPTFFVRKYARAAQFEFKSGADAPLDHPLNVNAVQMWRAIEEQSGGRIHVSNYPNNQLGNPNAMLSQLRLGALQFQIISISVLGTVVPAADIGSLGFAFNNVDEAIRVAGSGPLAEYIRKEIAAKNIYAFRTIWDAGMSQICSGTRPIAGPADLKGFRIRVTPSKLLVDLFKELGANPVSLSSGETYTGLQTKLVDGAQYTLGGIETNRLYEVQKYLSIINTTWSGIWVIMNGDAWKSLPPDLQTVVERNMTKYGLQQRADMKHLDLALRSKLQRQGLTVNFVDHAPFIPQLRNYYKEWSEVFGPTEWAMLQSSLGRTLT